MNFSIKAIAFFAALGLSACMETATSTPPSATETAQPTSVDAAASFVAPVVTQDFDRAGGGFTDGSYVVRFKMYEHAGEILICGAFTTSGTSIGQKFSRQAIREASLRLSDGTSVMNNFIFFKDGSNITSQRLALGVETVCRSTGLAAGSVPLDGFELVFREGNYRVRA